MHANRLENIINKLNDVGELTIGEALILKSILGLSDSEAAAVFLGGMNRENLQV